MRRIVTALTGAALALSLVAQATPAAAAVAGYDSAYAGESAFLTLNRGETGTFTVFFANTGTTTWLRGGTTQVDLAACLENKTTCNQQDASEAPFNSGWTSATRYATSTQTSVAPGSIGTFTYNVKVPAAAAAGTYRFNGALVHAATGADIHNEGYYQDVSVPAAAAAPAITSLDPDSGSDEGGDNVVVTGSGFVCSPSPSVTFGDDAATILSCGATSMTVETPAHQIPPGEASDTVDVVVTNSGGTASAPATFTYNLTSAPTFDSIAANGTQVILAFSQPVCTDGGELAGGGKLEVIVNGDSVDAENDSFADCGDDTFDATATIDLTDGLVPGDMVTVRITGTGADSVENAAGITMDHAQARSTEAQEDTVAPTVTDASVADSGDTIELTFSEGLVCPGGGDSADSSDFTVEDPDGDAVEIDDDVRCDGDTAFLQVEDSTELAEEGTFTVSYVGDDIEDVSGNEAETGSATFDNTAPIITSTNAPATKGFTADTSDTIEVVFDQSMGGEGYRDSPGDVDMQFLVEDSDGTTAVIACGWGGTADTSDGKISAICSWYNWNTDSDESSDTHEVIVLMEESTNSGDLLADGDFTGLQWPLTITDALGYISHLGLELDLDNSEDVTIQR